MENKTFTIEEAVKHLHNGGAILVDCLKYDVLESIFKIATPNEQKPSPLGNYAYYLVGNSYVGMDIGNVKGKGFLKLSNITKQSQSEEEGKENCEKCDGDGYYLVDEFIGGLQGRKDCNCERPQPSKEVIKETVEEEKPKTVLEIAKAVDAIGIPDVPKFKIEMRESNPYEEGEKGIIYDAYNEGFIDCNEWHSQQSQSLLSEAVKEIKNKLEKKLYRTQGGSDFNEYRSAKSEGIKEAIEVIDAFLSKNQSKERLEKGLKF